MSRFIVIIVIFLLWLYQELLHTMIIEKIRFFLFGTLAPLLLITGSILGLILFDFGSYMGSRNPGISEIIHAIGSTLSTAFLEEFFFRVILLSFLVRNLKVNWHAVALGSLIFALLHAGNSHVTLIALLSHFVGGLVYCYAYLKTNSIWLPLGLHFGWNYAQIIWGMPVSGTSYAGFHQIQLTSNQLISGGLYGYEGSMLSIITRIILLMATFWYLKVSMAKKQKEVSSVSKINLEKESVNR